MGYSFYYCHKCRIDVETFRQCLTDSLSFQQINFWNRFFYVKPTSLAYQSLTLVHLVVNADIFGHQPFLI